MPYDNGIIYVDTSVTPNRGVDVRDVQKALGTSKHYWNELCAHKNINPMAKYKPVQYDKIPDLTDREFASAHYGFGGQIPTFNANDKTTNVTWTYYKPRGGAYNEPYRITDFNNYDVRAAAPFDFEVSGELGYPSATGEQSGGIGISFYINNTAPTHSGSGLHWREDTCLSIGNMLDPYNLSGSFIGFAIHDLDKGDCVAIVTNIHPVALSSTVPTIVLNEYGQDEITQLTHREREGHRYTFVAFVVQNGPSGGKKYETIPVSQWVYSIAFAEGIDRQTVTLHFLDSIGKLEARISNVTGVTWTKGTETANWIEYKFSCYVYGSFTTPSVGSWAVNTCSVDVKIYNPNGYVEGSDATYSTEVDVHEYAHTYNNVLLCQVISASVKWPTQMPAAERKVEISAQARYIYEKKDFENTVSVYQQ